MKIGPLIGLAGVIVAALNVELNQAVSGLALPDISGNLGLSHDASTWFTSLYTSAQVVGMSVAAWLAVTVSLRRFALFAIALACVSTVLIPLSGNLTYLYTLRVLQGLSGGFTIPLLITIALRVLAPPVRLYGLAAYALTATFFPNLSAAAAGLWTDHLDWHFVFYQSVPLGTLAALLVWYGIPTEAPKYERLKIFDWRGASLVAIGFGSFTTLLQQGDRLDWFHSQLICVLALISVIAVPLLLVNEWFHKLPLIKLQLFSRRNLAYGCLALFIFIIISASSSTIPTMFLEQVQGYRPEQAQFITLEVAALQLLLLPGMALLLNIKWVDGRIVSFVGLGCILAACIGDSYLDTDWNRAQFYLWQMLQGIGAAMVVMPLLMFSTNAVKPEEGPFAGAAVNTPRAVAEAVSVWLIQLVTRMRGNLHSDRVTDQLGLERFRLIQGQGSSLMYRAPLLPGGTQRFPGSLRSLNGLVTQQVTALTISDLFLVIAGVVAILMVIVVLLPVRSYPPRIELAKH